MNQSWSDYDSDWFVSLISTATDVVVIFHASAKKVLPAFTDYNAAFF